MQAWPATPACLPSTTSERWSSKLDPGQSGRIVVFTGRLYSTISLYLNFFGVGGGRYSLYLFIFSLFAPLHFIQRRELRRGNAEIQRVEIKTGKFNNKEYSVRRVVSLKLVHIIKKFKGEKYQDQRRELKGKCKNKILKMES